LVARQSELNSQLDLDKGDQQGADSAPEVGEDFDKGKAVTTTASPAAVAKMAEAYMRKTGTAIREIPIVQRLPPKAGSATGRAVAKDESHVAVATSANRFIVVEAQALSREVKLGEHLSLLFHEGRPFIDDERDRGR